MTRSSWIWVEYQDEEGLQKRKKLKGFEARVFQHEYDHIEGVLHFDRFSEKDRARIQPTLDLLLEAHGPGGVLELSDEKKAALQPPLTSRTRTPPAVEAAAPKEEEEARARRLRGLGGKKKRYALWCCGTDLGRDASARPPQKRAGRGKWTRPIPPRYRSAMASAGARRLQQVMHRPAR